MGGEIMSIAELNGNAIELRFEDEAQQELLGTAMLRYQNARPEVSIEADAFAGIVLEWMQQQDREDGYRNRIRGL
jgi:hypothetical protein